MNIRSWRLLVQMSRSGLCLKTDSLEFRGELLHSEIEFGGLAWLGAVGVQYADRSFNAVGAEAFVPG